MSRVVCTEVFRFLAELLPVRFWFVSNFSSIRQAAAFYIADTKAVQLGRSRACTFEVRGSACIYCTNYV